MTAWMQRSEIQGLLDNKHPVFHFVTSVLHNDFRSGIRDVCYPVGPGFGSVHPGYHKIVNASFYL